MPVSAWLRARVISQGPYVAGLVLAFAAGTGLGLGLGPTCAHVGGAADPGVGDQPAPGHAARPINGNDDPRWAKPPP
ncbi:hypothetical protein [Sphaerisporangium perillae]|uniref:hypothetical protein n=1 Tax=Sphaerisporangium perillae TaxID=2935860 RepID=UPI00200F154F|nr:hypothetical protein [Sphaerisporangium perillae]